MKRIFKGILFVLLKGIKMIKLIKNINKEIYHDTYKL